jgi:hypothetical protein
MMQNVMNRRWLLAGYSEGIPTLENWTLDRQPVPDPGPGQIQCAVDNVGRLRDLFAEKWQIERRRAPYRKNPEQRNERSRPAGGMSRRLGLRSKKPGPGFWLCPENAFLGQ